MDIDMKINKVSDWVWEIPKTEKEGMQVPARIYASNTLLENMDKGVFDQITNVACLPGIQKYALCMPDGHWGYGFPIGGVAAFDIEDGVISPGGIGFDINCGMRLITTNLKIDEVKPRLRELINELFRAVPAGVGSKGILKVSVSEFKDIMKRGVDWCIEHGYGWPHDRERIEEYGCIPGADPSKVSEKAISRGINQLGTLGSGNHYLEIQLVTIENIFDAKTASVFGIKEKDQIVIMVHCGSRGFGHQIATDYLRVFDNAMKKYGMTVRDRELACAPFKSPEGSDYYKAMVCAANSAFVNRQVIAHRIRESFSKIFDTSAEKLGIEIVYDVAHNIAKTEKYKVNGKEKELLIHRKGSTRSFGPGRSELPEIYRNVGQPVIVGGSMQTGSYLLVGTERAMEETFGSTMHGSGRTMSRRAAKKKVRGDQLIKTMAKEGIIVKAVSMSGLAEEAGIAYKDISEVVETMDVLGISKKVVRLKPIGNIKG
ncbi:MAG: RNA-splicing ligase [Candidatus Scalindua rubra]|uniref:tRNA-splicing ligase RtcB n=1 Tax=Candidatus Scalindua rubra TaxID=1872076 RepID=A0A1E3X4G0_9BACT|nr:MAG: RNA-splicing ligase [Candidatus Scalindua rubra]